MATKQAATHRELILAGVEAEKTLASIARDRRPTEDEQAKARKAYRAAAKATAVLDSAIEQAYYRLAPGRQINVLKIGALFKTARLAMLNGNVGLESAVKDAIETHCEPEGVVKAV